MILGAQIHRGAHVRLYQCRLKRVLVPFTLEVLLSKRSAAGRINFEVISNVGVGVQMSLPSRCLCRDEHRQEGLARPRPSKRTHKVLVIHSILHGNIPQLKTTSHLPIMPGSGKQAPEVQAQIKELLEAGFDPTTIHRRLKVGRSSIYRMKRCLQQHGTNYMPKELNKKNGRPKVLTAEQELVSQSRRCRVFLLRSNCSGNFHVPSYSFMSPFIDFKPASKLYHFHL